MLTYLKPRIIFQILLFILCSFAMQVNADVVKPALIEISVNQKGEIDIEARVSIEALLTGINSQYKNTTEAPNAAEYDVFREMQSDTLKKEFTRFEQRFLNEIRLSAQTLQSNNPLPLEIIDINIPEPGYTKVPRISVIKMKSTVGLEHQSLSWFYPMSFGDNAVRVRQVNSQAQQYHWSEWQWLRNNSPSTPFSLTEIVAKTPTHHVIGQYLYLGFMHILPKGLDHILFILGLFFFSTAFKSLFWQITMFTFAHTITLGLSINGIINLPSHIVEPLIALSIVYIGVENILSSHLSNRRLIVVFLFGLLHGMGFASVLADFGLPTHAFITALVSFNIGVELGQLVIILFMFLFIGMWFRKKTWYRTSISIPASLIISSVALIWFIQRLNLSLLLKY